MFAGIRPEEVARLDWAAVNLETRTVEIQGKTRRYRHVALEPVALALLKPFAECVGPVAPTLRTIARWRKGITKKIGLERWPQDLLRHTAASYLLGLHKSPSKVAMILGNSEKVLMSHYYRPITEADCRRFWEVSDPAMN